MSERAPKLDVTLTSVLNFLELEFWTSSFVVNVVRTGGGGGGVLPEKKKVGGVRPASQNPYPIYDQNLRYSLPYL